MTRGQATPIQCTDPASRNGALSRHATKPHPDKIFSLRWNRTGMQHELHANFYFYKDDISWLHLLHQPALEAAYVGGAERDRTADLCSAIAALSQLSYGPKLRHMKYLAVWWS